MIHFVTIAYAQPEMLKAMVQQVVATFVMTTSWYFWDNCYPLCNVEELRSISQFVFSAGKNIGLHDGFNALTSHMSLNDEDFIVVLDPDCYPITPGWDQALIEKLREYPDLAYVSLPVKAVFETPDRTWDYSRPGLAIPDNAVEINITAWRWSFLKQVGGFSETCKYYGGLEASMFPKARALGMRHAVLLNYEQSDVLCADHDRVYQQYKCQHAHSESFKGSFEEYLRANVEYRRCERKTCVSL